MPGYNPVYAEVNLSAICHNINSIKALLNKPTRLCIVVKADGYGHGAIAVARQAVQAGAEYLGVAVLEEARQLRQAGFTEPVLILGYTPEEQAGQVVAHQLTQTIYTAAQAQALSAAAQAQQRTVKVHLKIDTGMGRLGIEPAEAGELAKVISALPQVELEGLYTHFAKADSLDSDYTQQQFTNFSTARQAVREQGLNIPIIHCANSAATLNFQKMHLDMVRTGIITYGLYPSAEISHPGFHLRPALKLKARIAYIKQLPAGAFISYGCTYQTTRPTRIATLPLGYADGFSRRLSGKASVSICGRRAPVVGTICMDQCLIDITDIPQADTQSEVLLFGGEELPVEEVAAALGTINYEVVCMVGKRVPRVYLK